MKWSKKAKDQSQTTKKRKNKQLPAEFQKYQFDSRKKFSFGKKGTKKSITNLTPQQTQVIDSSIPRLQQDQHFRVGGGFFLLMIAILAVVFLVCWMMGALHAYAIGINSSNKTTYNNFSFNLFFFLVPDFWKQFILKNGSNLYGLFSTFITNFQTASEGKLYFAIGAYLTIFALIGKLVLIFIWFIISLFQKNNRNCWICCFSLIPVINIFITIYFLGVMHYENTYLIQRIWNQQNQLTSSAHQPAMTFSNQLFFPKMRGEVFSYEDPIGQKIQLEHDEQNN